MKFPIDGFLAALNTDTIHETHPIRIRINPQPKQYWQ